MTESGYGRWFADLIVVAVVAVLSLPVLSMGGVPWPIRWTFGISMLVFVPGYAILSMVFPERPEREGRPEGDETPNWPVLLGLAVATSALLSAVVGTAFVTLDDLALVPVTVALAAITLLAAGVASVRRAHRAPYVRRAPFRDGALEEWLAALPGGREQTLALVLAVALLFGAVGLTAAFPPTGERFSEFSVLEATDDGELVAEGYPSSVVAGEGHRFHVAIENHEHRGVTYRVVVVAQNVSNGEVTDQQRLDSFDRQLADGERTVVSREVVPKRTGEDVRIQFLLYKDEVPSTASAESAAIALQVWTDVVPRANGTNSTRSTATADSIASAGSTATADSIASAGSTATADSKSVAESNAAFVSTGMPDLIASERSLADVRTAGFP